MNYLENNEIHLRALEPEDLELLYRWENDMSLWSKGNTLTPYSRFALRKYMESQTEDLYATRQLRLMVVLKKENKAIGTIDMFDFDPFHNRAGAGILIESEYQNSGMGSQALELFIGYAFGFLKLKQLYCHIADDNLNSLAVFRKQGFEIAGNLKSWLKTQDGWKDLYMLQLINDF